MKNLLIAAVGNESLHRYWFQGTREFDSYLIYYGENLKKYIDESDYYQQRKGLKFFLIHSLMKEDPELFKKYQSIFIPDDDIYLTTPNINRLFQIFNENEFELAQPSIMGWYTHEITLHDPKWIWRCTNFVEVMCPVFSQNALFLCRESFVENPVSWGIDWVWSKILGHPRDKIAVIDDVIALHTRAMEKGDFYKNESLKNIDPKEEMQKTFNRHNIQTNYEVYHSFSKWKNINSQPSHLKIYPHFEKFQELLKDMRNPKRIPMI